MQPLTYKELSEQSYHSLISYMRHLETENAELKRRLPPNLGPIVEALRGVGLYAWMASAAKKDPNLLDEIAAMNAAAAAGDIPALVANYVAIVAIHPPSGEQLQSWQAVLDAAGVPPQILAFAQHGGVYQP
jgi:hypothetical protein